MSEHFGLGFLTPSKKFLIEVTKFVIIIIIIIVIIFIIIIINKGNLNFFSVALRNYLFRCTTNTQI